MRYDYVKVPSYIVPLDDFMALCIEARTEVIHKYPSACSFNIEVYQGDYEDDCPYVVISFKRDPTDKELEDELEIKKLSEEREKLQYEKLKAKFEGK